MPLRATDGPGVVVQLLADDAATWVPWILTRSVDPGTPLANRFTPLLWSEAAGGVAGAKGGAAGTGTGDGGGGGGPRGVGHGTIEVEVAAATG